MNYRKRYQAYLEGPAWAAVSDRCKVAAGGKCSVCGSVEHLESHHVTYSRIYHESIEDLVCLCRSCHGKEHE